MSHCSFWTAENTQKQSSTQFDSRVCGSAPRPFPSRLLPLNGKSSPKSTQTPHKQYRRILSPAHSFSGQCAPLCFCHYRRPLRPRAERLLGQGIAPLAHSNQRACAIAHAFFTVSKGSPRVQLAKGEGQKGGCVAVRPPADLRHASLAAANVISKHELVASGHGAIARRQRGS